MNLEYFSFCLFKDYISARDKGELYMEIYGFELIILDNFFFKDLFRRFEDKFSFNLMIMCCKKRNFGVIFKRKRVTVGAHFLSMASKRGLKC